MTDEKRKSMLRRIEIIVESCKNICEESSQYLQDQAKIVAYDRIERIVEEVEDKE